MRAEAVSWDEMSTSHAPPLAEDDKWHVALAPGEVKVVSLEQLDDLFRLSIVDAETKVWQTGMGEWLPLRVIAGIEDEPALPSAPKRTHPKPPSPRSAPPAAPSPSVAPVQAAPISFYPAATSVAPAKQAAPGSVAPSEPFSVNSVRPLVVSQAPAPAQRSSGFGRLLVGLALVAGVGISLYRNDVLRDAAHSVHQEGLYAQFEAALGGPAFGTLRAVDQGANGSSRASTNVDASTSNPTDRASTLGGAPDPSHNALEQATPLLIASTPIVPLESLVAEKKPLPAASAPLAVRSSPNPTPARSGHPAASPVKSAPAPKLEKPAPASVKSTANQTEREKLDAAIGRSMSAPLPKANPKASEYDPLNPTL